jgi:hypothetical protein
MLSTLKSVTYSSACFFAEEKSSIVRNFVKKAKRLDGGSSPHHYISLKLQNKDLQNGSRLRRRYFETEF